MAAKIPIGMLAEYWGVDETLIVKWASNGEITLLVECSGFWKNVDVEIPQGGSFFSSVPVVKNSSAYEPLRKETAKALLTDTSTDWVRLDSETKTIFRMESKPTICRGDLYIDDHEIDRFSRTNPALQTIWGQELGRQKSAGKPHGNTIQNELRRNRVYKAMCLLLFHNGDKQLVKKARRHLESFEAHLLFPGGRIPLEAETIRKMINRDLDEYGKKLNT